MTVVDISSTATQRVADRARALGLGDRVAAECRDLAHSFPDGRFDLVSAQYFHTPLPIPRARILRTAAEAVVRGGRLLVVDHGSTAPWSWNQGRHTRYPSPHQVAADLHLEPPRWAIERADTPQRRVTGPNRQTAEVVDNVLLARRVDQ